jgi:hypothetical protein
MTDNKLFELINMLTGVEKREFSKYLQSPYFNQRSDVLRFWEFILTKSNKEISIEVAFREIYPEDTFNSLKWRQIQSFLLLQVENFLAQRAVEQLPLLSDLYLAPIYRQKNLRKPLEYVLRRANEKLLKTPPDLQFYYHQYLLESEKYASIESQARTKENNLATINLAFDVFACATKLRLACLMESHRAVFNTEYEDAILEAMLPVLQKNGWLKIPIISLYFHCYQALTKGNEQDFQAFRREIEQLPPNFPVEERRTFLLLAVNFCIRRLNSGEAHYVREAFNFYKVGLETKALFENGYIGRFGFKNIVALGLNLNEHAWVVDFIENYAPFLEEKHRVAHRDYNLAKVFYAQKKYEKAMPLLARVDESDLLLNLDSRIMLLKMYYETDEIDALDALIGSFKILLLRKKKVIGYHQTHYLNTLRYLQKLTKLNFMDKKAVEKLLYEVKGNKALIERNWILERLETY